MPAAHCGIVGFKPTYGRVSTRGVMTLSWTLDHVGPMCKTVEDAAMMLNIVAGYDDRDPTTIDVPVPDYARALRQPTSKLRLGIPRRPFFDNLDPDVAKATDAALDVLRRLTARGRGRSAPRDAQSRDHLDARGLRISPSLDHRVREEVPTGSTRASLQRGADGQGGGIRENPKRG